jgi:hypothetical protein
MAMREAAYWWQQAVQTASDERDDAQATFQAWDPAASFDARRARRQFLAADGRGYLERALAATQVAERLARTPLEKERARRQRRSWGEAARPEG